MAGDAAARRTAGDGETFTVYVESVSYITQFTGGTGAGTQEFPQQVHAGVTVREVMQRMSAGFPKLREILWDGQEMGEHVEVIVNDTFLGEEYTLDTPVKPEDRILLIGQFTGG